MDSITTQQLQQQQQQSRNILKIVFLFAALGLSAYITYRISRSLAQEITDEIT